MLVMVVTTHARRYRQPATGRLEQPECLGGGGPAEDPAGPVIELRGDRVHVVLGEGGQIGSLVRVLAQQLIRVLVRAPPAE
jgi:hypothetical protein